jgi:hypothetical protein
MHRAQGTQHVKHSSMPQPGSARKAAHHLWLGQTAKRAPEATIDFQRQRVTQEVHTNSEYREVHQILRCVLQLGALAAMRWNRVLQRKLVNYVILGQLCDSFFLSLCERTRSNRLLWNCSSITT